MKRNLINCIITTTNIEVSMSFAQWRSYQGGEMNLAEIKMINDLDFQLSKVNIDTYKLMVFSLALLLNLLTKVSVTAFAVGGSEAIPMLGNKFLGIIQEGMYYVCACKGVLEVGKEVVRGGDNLGKIGKIIISYIIAFATIYIFPWAFDTVKETFGTF